MLLNKFKGKFGLYLIVFLINKAFFMAAICHLVNLAARTQTSLPDAVWGMVSVDALVRKPTTEGCVHIQQFR
jgi:hypothetical protein